MVTETVTKRIIELDIKASADAIQQVKRMQSSMKELEQSIKSVKDFGKNMMGGIVAAFSAGAVVNGIKSVIEEMDKANEAAVRMGLSVEQLQEWNYAAEMSGASAEELEAGVRGLSKSMIEMDKGTTAASAALKEMGVKATDTTDTALRKVVAGFEKMGEGPRKAALAMDIFGKSGTKLLPMLKEGTEGILEMQKEVHELGAVFSTEGAQAAAEFGDNVDKLKMAAKGTGQQLAEGLLPALNSVALGFIDAVKGSKELQETGDALGTFFHWIAKQVLYVGSLIQAFGKMIAGIAVYAVEAFKGNFEGAREAFRAMQEDIDELEKRTLKRLADMDAELEKRKKAREAAKSFVGPPEPPPREADASGILGAKGGKPKKDEQVEELKRYTEGAKKAANAVSEMTHAEELEYLVSEKKIDRSAAKTKALYEEARAIAALADATEAAEKERKETETAYKEGQKAADEYHKSLADMREEFLRMNDPIRALVEQYEQLSFVMASTTDPEQLAQLERVQKQLNMEAGKMSEQLAKSSAEGLKKPVGMMAEMGTLMQDKIKGFADTATDAMLDFTGTTKASFSDMVESILKDLAKIALKKAMTPALEGIAGFVGRMFGPAAQGAVMGPAGVLPFAAGGVVSSPTYFAAGGTVGVMGEAGPEAIVPLERTSSGKLGVGASPVYVTVVNNSSSRIKTEETQDPNGKTSIQIMVEEAVEKSLGRGRYDRVLSTSYGISRKGR